MARFSITSVIVCFSTVCFWEERNVEFEYQSPIGIKRAICSTWCFYIRCVTHSLHVLLEAGCSRCFSNWVV